MRLRAPILALSVLLPAASFAAPLSPPQQAAVDALNVRWQRYAGRYTAAFRTKVLPFDPATRSATVVELEGRVVPSLRDEWASIETERARLAATSPELHAAMAESDANAKAWSLGLRNDTRSLQLAGHAADGVGPAPRGGGLRINAGARLFALQRRTARTVAGTRGHIEDIKAQIDHLEIANTEKQQTSLELISQIDTRTNEIRSNQSRKRTLGILGALYGMPAVAAVGLVQVIQDDGRLRDLNARLAIAHTEQADIQARIARHVATKASLTVELDKLRVIEGELATRASALHDAGPPTSLEQAQARLGLSRGLLGNLRTQVSILGSVHASAADLGVKLDDHVAHLRLDVAQAEKLVDESTKAFVELLEIMLKKNPNAAAGKWLNKQVTKLVAQKLQAAGLGKPAADMLAKRMFPKASDQDRFADQVDGELL